MRKAIALLLALALLLAVSILAMGCDKENVRVRAGKVDDYNAVIGKYDKLSLAFTDLAREINKKNVELNEKYWQKYDKQKAKVLARIDALEKHNYIDSDVEKIKPLFGPYIADMHEYMDLIDNYRADPQGMTKKDLLAKLDPIYKDLLQQSRNIAAEFNVIYEEDIIIKEKKEKEQN